ANQTAAPVSACVCPIMIRSHPLSPREEPPRAVEKAEAARNARGAEEPAAARGNADGGAGERTRRPPPTAAAGRGGKPDESRSEEAPVTSGRGGDPSVSLAGPAARGRSGPVTGRAAKTKTGPFSDFESTPQPFRSGNDPVHAGITLRS